MSIALCCCALMACTIVLHRASADHHLPRRPAFADVAAVIVAAWIFALLFCVSGMPLFSLILGILFITALWVINASKKRVLRDEPLVITDIALLWQTIRFPSLYLPFLPCKLLLAGFVASSVILTVLWKISPAQHVAMGWWLVLAAPFMVIFLLRTRQGNTLAAYLSSTFPLEFDPRADSCRYGPLGAALLHTVWHLTRRGLNGMGVCNSTEEPGAPPSWYTAVLRKRHETIPREHLPHIFLVQCESFCDARAFSPAVPKDVLKNWDGLCAEGKSGRLQINDFGAYTMRTEYAVLTGQPAATMGTDAFHPYLGAARYPSWSIARYLKQLGYHTVCLHPFYRAFFCRSKAIPNLGFDEFVTQENFPHAETWGPYVSDRSVALSMLDLLREQDQPVFCFAITMESHGPWLSGRFQKEGERGKVPSIPGLDAAICRYLVHLRHSDEMFGMLRNGLKLADRPAVLSCYGDHLPNLPELIPLGATATPYVVWRTDWNSRNAGQADITPGAIGEYLLSFGT